VDIDGCMQIDIVKNNFVNPFKEGYKSYTYASMLIDRKLCEPEK
jgi:hypothetical protein